MAEPPVPPRALHKAAASPAAPERPRPRPPRRSQAQAAPAAPVPPAAVARRILQSLKGPIPPVPVGPLYRVGLALVAVAMLVLPLIYLALVGLAGYVLVYHAVHNVGLLSARVDFRLLLILYLTPLVVGGILLLFMVKPLFAHRRRRSEPLSLAREEQPLLFEFVERLCQIVGAPVPVRINVDTEVNASAGFLGGPAALLTNRLVLTIGLPLVAGLTLRQFAGVLAHEFGHFAQGSAMRLSYLIRTTNIWFARVVYERDEWDYRLMAARRGSGHALVGLVVALASLFVWLTRRVLWCLMWVGHAASSFMLRQMEFDADRYEARVAGATAFGETMDRLVALNVAAAAAFADLDAAWRERRLCDDLPSLISARERELPPDALRTVRKRASERKTGWFDTHPSDARRLESARREEAPGLFKQDAPASALFHDFEDLCRRATVAFYFRAVGSHFQPENLVKTDALVESGGRRRQNVQAMRRFFCDLVSPVRPVFPHRFTVRPAPGSPLPRADVAAERLLELRSALSAAAPLASAAAKAFERLDERVYKLECVRELATAGIKTGGKVAPKPQDLGVDSLAPDVVLAEARAAAADRQRARGEVDRVLDGTMERLTLALSLEPALAAANVAPANDAANANVPESTPASSDNGDADFRADYGVEYDLADGPAEGSDDRMLDALRALRESAAAVEELRRHFVYLGALLSEARPGDNPKPLIQAVIWHSRKASDLLRAIHTTLRGPAYPYSHADSQTTLAAYAVPAQPPPEQPVAVYHASEAVLDAVYPLYVRLLSDLAARAEQVESALGLPPMPDPPEEPEANGAS